MNTQKLKLGLVALVVGFGLVITQSAFTPKTNAQNHQYAQLQDGTWVEPNDELFECVVSQRICKGTFSYTNPAPNDMPDVSIDQENATYQLKTP